MSAPLGPEQFTDFFTALHGYPPYSWQERLCEYVLTTGTWPTVIDAPTGAGKTSVIDVHVFANAAAAASRSELRPPRRLAITVARRALVDDNAEHAQAISDKLNSAEQEPGVLGEVARALRGLRTWGPEPEPDDAPSVLEVASLRGGARPSRDWLDDPVACQVIAATPDMWGSRLLFNAYGATRASKPRHAGMLALDAVAVIDEAHLNRQLLVTARRVAELVTHEVLPWGGRPLQVVEMTATPSRPKQDMAVGVLPEDLSNGGTLTERLTRPKPVVLKPTTHLPRTGSSVTQLADQIVDELLSMSEGTVGTLGCVVNTVALAVEIADRLRGTKLPENSGSLRAGRPPVVVTILGRMRPADLDRQRAEHPGLFRLDGDQGVDVVVATQTIEVGIDMDFAGMVTELAPGTAIAQRAGRVNRSGSQPVASVIVMVPDRPGALSPTKTLAPYVAGDLIDALQWLQERSQDPQGLAPWALHPRGGGHVPPGQALRRVTCHRPELWNVWHWARTSQDLYAPIDLTLWLEDDLSADTTASVVVRQGLPRDVDSARRQIAAALPAAHEEFLVPVRSLNEALFARADDGFGDRPPRAFRVRDKEVVQVGHTNSSRPGDTQQHADHAKRVRPGDIVILDDGVPMFRGHVFDTNGTERADDVSEAALDAVGHNPAASAWRSVRIGHRTPLLADTAGASRLLERLGEIVAEATDDPDERVEQVLAELRTWLESTTEGAPTSRRLLADLLEHMPVLSYESDPMQPEDFWVVVSGKIVVADDDELRQLASPAGHHVTLDDHATMVASTARDVADRLTLDSALADALHDAGQHHDDGKRDSRFQRSLRPRTSRTPVELFAKSGTRDRREIVAARNASGLPAGWRHEQLSAAYTWAHNQRDTGGTSDTDADTDPNHRTDPELVTLLVGTSHGHGHGMFHDTAARLLAGTEPEDVESAAIALFDHGGWEELLESTQHRYGVWGVAYLEALLRAVDVTVSRRGS